MKLDFVVVKLDFVYSDKITHATPQNFFYFISFSNYKLDCLPSWRIIYFNILKLANFCEDEALQVFLVVTNLIKCMLLLCQEGIWHHNLTSVFCNVLRYKPYCAIWKLV